MARFTDSDLAIAMIKDPSRPKDVGADRSLGTNIKGLIKMLEQSNAELSFYTADIDGGAYRELVTYFTGPYFREDGYAVGKTIHERIKIIFDPARESEKGHSNVSVSGKDFKKLIK